MSRHLNPPVHDPLDLLLIATVAIPTLSAAVASTVSTTGEATEVVQTTGGVTGMGSEGGWWTKIQEQPVPGRSAHAQRTATT
jgi:enolase